MKQLLVLGAVIVSSLSACKKDYTCTCTTSVGDVNKYEYKSVKKKDAEKDCKATAKDYYDNFRKVQVTETCVLD